MIDINKFITAHNRVISSFAMRYHNNYDYDDFRQELMIEVWHHMEKYNELLNDSPVAYLLSFIDILALRVLQKFNSDKVGRFHASFTEIAEDYFLDQLKFFKGENVDSHDVDVSAYGLSEIEKRIVFCIDYDTKVKAKDIAINLGITPRMLYYHIKNIREKIKNHKKDE